MLHGVALSYRWQVGSILKFISQKPDTRFFFLILKLKQLKNFAIFANKSSIDIKKFCFRFLSFILLTSEIFAVDYYYS